VPADVPNEGEVDHREVARRGRSGQRTVGPTTGFAKPITVAMAVIVALVVIYGVVSSITNL
jgi:hypothetical protein